MAYNPILKLLQKKDEDLGNIYDDGSVWSKPIETPSTSSNFAKLGGSSNLFDDLLSQTSVEDPLQAPRNQMQYYTNQLDKLGVDPVEPDTNKGNGGILGLLQKITAVPASIGNALSGTLEGVRKSNLQTQNAMESTEAYKKMKSLGYSVDGSTIIDDKTGKRVKYAPDEINELYKQAWKESKGERANALDIVGNIGKESVSSFLNTYKDAFTGTNDASDLYNIMSRYEDDGTEASKNRRKTGTLEKLATDIAFSFGTGGITDLNDVGKTIKYLNKADKVNDVSKVANNMDEALKLVKETTSFDDFVNSYTLKANDLNKAIPSTDELQKLYNNSIKANAEKLMRDTNKYLGGINDFDGLKLGNTTIISKASLDKINTNAIQKGLLEAGLSLYSPVGAIMQGNLTNVIGDIAGKSDTVQAFNKEIGEKFRYGKNGQYVQTAIDEFNAGNTDEVMKNIAQKTDLDIRTKRRDINKMHIIAEGEQMKKDLGDGNASKVTYTMEQPEEVIKTYGEVAEKVTNPEYIKAVKERVYEHFDELDKNITTPKTDVSYNAKKADIEKEISNLDNLIKDSSISFTKKLEELNLQGNEKYFTQSVSMSLDELTSLLKKDGIQNPYESAKALKKASNDVIDTIEKNNPNLKGLFSGSKEFDFSNIVSGNGMGDMKDGVFKPKWLDKVDDTDIVTREYVKPEIKQEVKKEHTFIEEQNKVNNKPEEIISKEAKKARKQTEDDIKLIYSTHGDKMTASRRELISMLDDEELIKYKENSIVKDRKLEGKELLGKAKDLMKLDNASVKRFESIKQKVLDIVSDASEYDNDTLALFVKNTLEKNGIKVSPMDKKMFSFVIGEKEYKGIYDYIEDKLASGYSKKLSSLNKNEIDLYINKVKQNIELKKQSKNVADVKLQNYKDGDFSKLDNLKDDVDLDYETKKRQDWFGEQSSTLETKEYQGGDKEYKAVQRGEEVETLVKENLSKNSYKFRESIQNIGYEDMKEWANWKANMLKNKDPETSEYLRDLANGTNRVELEIAMTDDLIVQNAIHRAKKYSALTPDKVKKISSINTNIFDKYQDVFESVNIKTELYDISKWTNFEQGVFYDTLNFDKNLNKLAKNFPNAYKQLAQKTDMFASVDYATVKYVSDFVSDIKARKDFENMGRKFTQDFDTSILKSQEELATELESLKIDSSKPITSETLTEIKNKADVEETVSYEPVVKEESPKVETPKAKEEPKSYLKENKIFGYEFDLGNGRKVVLDQNMNPKDVERVITEHIIADETIYTKLDGAVGFVNKDTNKQFLDVSMKGKSKEFVENFEIIKTHEDMHWIQNKLNTDGIAKNQVVKFMKELAEAPKEKIDDIIKLVKMSAIDDTSEELLRKGVISGYVNNVYKSGASNFDKIRETDAVIGSLLLTNNKAVREQAIKVFGKDIFKTYMDNLSKYSDVEWAEVKKLSRVKVEDELNSKLDTLRNVATTFGGDKAQHDTLVELAGLIEDIELNSGNLDSIDKLVEVVKKYKDIDAKSFYNATKGIKEQITMIKDVEMLNKIDLTKDLTKQEKAIYDRVKDRFMKWGELEGLSADDNTIRSNYVFHMINPELKMNEKAYKIARDKFGSSISDVFNVHKLNRKYEGTIQELNASFKKSLEKAGIEAMDLFETNIVDIFMKRGLGHEDYMFKEGRQASFISRFGMKDIKNFQKEVDTVENLKHYMETFLNRYEIKDYDMSQIVKDFKESNKTLYQFLKENYKDYGIKKMYEDEIRELNGASVARDVTNGRFGTESSYNRLSNDYTVFNNKGEDRGLKMLDEDTVRVMYNKKLEEVEKLKSIGLTEKSYKDNRAIAESKGLRYVDNSNVRVEASDILNQEQKSLHFETKEELAEWRRSRGQEIRRELRAKYKKDSSVHYAHNDIEINYQKAYKDLMEDMVSKGDYVEVTKTGRKQVEKLKTIGKDVEVGDLSFDNISDFSIVDKSSVRTKSVLESNDESYIFKKKDWENYQKELERQAKRTESAFLKAVDKANMIFKSMALASGRFLSNTVFGNFFESYMTAGVNLANPKYVKMYRDFKKGKDFSVNGHSVTEIMHSMDNLGVLETMAKNEMLDKKLYNNPVYKRLTNKVDEELTPMQKLGKKTQKVNPFSTEFGFYKGINKTQENLEEMSRFINMVTHLDNGKSMAESAELVNKALFDYSDMSQFENDVMKRIIPFYTFMRKNIPLQLENLSDKTGKVARVQGLYEKVDSAVTDEKERKLRPDYLKNALPLGNGKYLNLPNPIQDLEKLFNPKEVAQGLSPLIKTPIELMLNKQMYSGSDISKYDKTKEKIGYSVNSLFPIFNTYGKAIDKAKEGDFSSLANIIGVPIKTFDTAKAEKQTMYEYVTKLQNQYYELLEKNPELKSLLEKEEKSKTYIATTSKKKSPLSSILNKR